MRWLAAAMAAAALVAAPPAAAQAPISLGPGQFASVIVDAAGTAHIAFDSGAGSTYCRLPRKASACDVRSFLPLDGAASPQIVQRGDGVLVLIVPASTGTYLRTSADGGVTWSAPVAISPAGFASVALAPGEQSVFTVGYGTSVVNVRHLPLAGGETRALNLLFGDEAPISADLSVLADGRVVVIFGDGERTRWRVFGGGDVYDINAWASSGVLRGISGAELVSGPRGIYLFDHRSLAAQRTGRFAAPFALRSFDARRLRWRATRPFAADRSIFGTSTAIQDPRGRIHVVADTPGAGSTECVLYTRTGPRRSSWFGKTTVLFRTANSDRAPEFSRVAAGRDGRGFAVWQDTGGEMWATPLRQARGKYRPRANQNDRPACVGRRYS
jgi:hypothetical protein